MNKDFSSIKVGDKLLRRYRSNWGECQYQVVSVDKVTPAGFIKFLGETYGQDGRKRGDRYSSYSIVPFDQSLLDEQKARIEHRNRARGLGAIDWQHMDASLVAKIHSLLPKDPEDSHA